MSQALKDFVKGMGQALDLGATLAPDTNSGGRKSQTQAINGYWRSVGKNMDSAMRQSASQAAPKTSVHSVKKR